ncbi:MULTISPECIES: MFS transporter [unclassified Streptomyces]|uniref:MFS transporter n=1 Tax=unclassified Streptomyces TaxID=2593676 RepID=UPI002E81EF45|nr:MFS transporter [Streptomyces sp. NBC_00589]WTI38523.1 MFS transporter [Streptomyces sp. NBC_00775]WUB27798.1 MFS transporter [Streptomyces sp. NBC_00589]
MTTSATDARRQGLLIVLAGNMLIDALEVSTLVVAMPSIAADLHLSPTAVQWTMSAFALGFGGLMLFGTRLVELLGRRRVYLAGLLLFAAASVVAAFAGDPALLAATRFVKGFCVALTAPTGLAIISTAFEEGPARQKAVSVYSFFGACGFTAGLVLSGVLTAMSWRWTLAFPAPVVLVLFAFCLRLIPAGPAAAGPRRFDAAGATALAGALVALVCAIVSAGSAIRTGIALAVLAVLVAAFVAIERRAPRPLVKAAAVTSGPLIRSALGGAAFNGSYLGLLFVATFQLQARQGWSPLVTALALLPASLPLALTSLFSGRMVRRFGGPPLIAAGAFLALLGYLVYPREHPPQSYAVDVLPTLLLVGAGFVLAFAPLNMQAASGVPAELRPMAGGVFQAAVQTGAAVAVSSAAVLSERSGGGAALRFVAVLSAFGLLVALTGLLPRRLPRTGAPRSSASELRR